MNKLASILITVVVILTLAAGSAFACNHDNKGYCKTIEGPDFKLEVSNYVGIEGMNFQGTQEVKGCNADGMYEKSKMEFVGSSAGVSAVQTVEMTGNVCTNGCKSDIGGAVAGSIINFSGNTNIAGNLNKGGATAHYGGNLNFSGNTNIAAGNINF